MSGMGKSERRFLYITLAMSFALMGAIIYFILTEVYISENTAIEKIMQKIDENMIDQAYELLEQYSEKIPEEKIAEIQTECEYKTAIAALDAGNTKDAHSIFNTLSDKKDVSALLKECDYVDAINLLDKKNYEEASYKFIALSEYKDSPEKLNVCKYNIAEAYYRDGQYTTAFDLFTALGDYEDASDMADKMALEITGASDLKKAYALLASMNDAEIKRYAALNRARKSIPRGALAVGADFTVGLQKDNTVVAAGSNEYGQCDVEKWTDIIAVDVGYHHTLALKSDGTVVATGLNDNGQCDVDEWKDVVQITAGAYDSYGLCSDGTILAAGFHSNAFVEGLTNIKIVEAGSYGVVCVGKNNEIITPFPSLQEDIAKEAVEVSISTGYVMSLSKSGEVKTSLQLKEDWQDVIAISAGTVGALAIKADNTLYAHFFKQRDSFDYEGLTDVIAIAAGGGHHAIMLKGGKVLTFGANDFGQCDVGDWVLME